MDLKIEIKNIINWTKEYFEDANCKKAIVGISGGIDSAVTAAICVEALGAKNVIGVILPCYSQLLDRKLAELLGDRLQINYIQLDLEDTFDVFWSDYRETTEYNNNIFPDEYNKLVNPNIKARLRMVSLYAVAGHVDGLVVGTTNKTEALLGYATKYGDGGVDIEPLMDFYKTEIFKIAEKLSLPMQIIDRPPSAGLWDGQTDEDELGMKYAEIDKYLEAKEKNWAQKFDTELSNKIEKLIIANKHKDLKLPYYHR